MTTQGRTDIRELFEIKDEKYRIIHKKADDVLAIAKSIANQVFSPAPHIMWRVEDFHYPPIAYSFGDGVTHRSESPLRPSMEKGNYAVNITYSSMDQKEIRVKVLIEPLAGAYYDIEFGDNTYRLNLIETYNKEQLDLQTKAIGKDIHDYIVGRAHALFYKDNEWVQMISY